MENIDKILEPLDEAIRPIHDYLEKMKEIHNKFN